MLASGANLRALYLTADEAAQLLLAAQRLSALSPRLAFDQPLAGAVVGVSDFRGVLTLRRVARVDALALNAEGEPAGGRCACGGARAAVPPCARHGVVVHMQLRPMRTPGMRRR